MIRIISVKTRSLTFGVYLNNVFYSTYSPNVNILRGLALIPELKCISYPFLRMVENGITPSYHALSLTRAKSKTK